MINRCEKFVIGHPIGFLLCFFLINWGSEAQVGLINDDFSTGSDFGWVNSSGGTAIVEDCRLVVSMTKQASGKYRGDIKRADSTVLHAGNYPILAVKFNKPPKCSFFLDTPLGSYNNSNNNAVKIEMSTSNVYYWDIAAGTFGITKLSTTSSTSISFVQLKVADVELTQAQLDAHDTTYQVDWVRTYPSVDSLRIALDPNWTNIPKLSHPVPFKHPGLLHDSTDLARLKMFVHNKKTVPYSCYQLFIENKKSSSNYVIKGPYTKLTRDASLTVDGVGGGTIHAHVESDFLAAYYNALMWAITGEQAHAEKAKEIIDGYSSMTTAIAGSDAELNGLYGFMLANAAEILSHTKSGWSIAKITACQNMLQNVFYPVLENFRPCAHGNWDIISMKCLMAIAIFCDDHDMYNRVVNYFYYGEGNGSITRYVVSDEGQLQESNRDQPHTMLAIGSLAELAEMAYKQGDDLYSAHNNAILRGFEYTSKYNCGYDVPYQLHYDYCEKNYQDYTPEKISAKNRGAFRSVFEIAYNHYTVRKGLAMPFTAEVIAKMRPEGASFGADNPGYGTLLFYLEPTMVTKNAVGKLNNFLQWKLNNGLLSLENLPKHSKITVFNCQGKRITAGLLDEKNEATFQVPGNTLYIVKVKAQGISKVINIVPVE